MANNWLKKLKISLINEDIQTLMQLISEFKEVKFKGIEQLNEASSLVLQTKELFESKKIHLEGEMQKLKSAKKYAS